MCALLIVVSRKQAELKFAKDGTVILKTLHPNPMTAVLDGEETTLVEVQICTPVVTTKQ